MNTGMHELSVAQNIIEIIQQSVPRSEWNQVTAVRIKIGAVAGIVPDSLKFSLEKVYVLIIGYNSKGRYMRRFPTLLALLS